LLDMTKAVSGTGTVNIATKSTFEADSKLSVATVSFASGGTSQVLALKQPSTTTSTIAGYGKGDKIDLLGIVANKLSYSGTTTAGTLTIANGATLIAQLKFSGNYTTASFSLASDGKGGTNITGTGLLAAAVSDLTSVGGYNVTAPSHSIGGSAVAIGGASFNTDVNYTLDQLIGALTQHS
jgi:hypothetical protein